MNTLSPFAELIFKRTYAAYPEETWEDCARRVASFVSHDHPELEEDFYEMISQRKFIPGGRYLAQSGKEVAQLTNCFLCWGEDSREGWANLLSKHIMALSTGGGVGTYYGDIRPSGTPIKRFGGVASGPVSLMNMVNEMARHVMAGGKRRCLPEGTLVHTCKGLVPIEKILPGEEILTFDGYRKVKAVMDQGVQPLVCIKTQTGDFKCTGNHRVAVLKNVEGDYSWKLAQDLVPGDRLIFVPEILPGEDTTLPAFSYSRPLHSTTCKDITIPTLDKDLAWFIGYFHGNGCVHLEEGKGSVQVSVPQSSPETIQKAETQLARFGVNVITRKGDGQCLNAIACSRQLSLYLSQWKQPNSSMDVPSFILRGKPEVRAGYLAGLLDADGSVKTRPVCAAASIYPDFLKQVQAVYSSLGIPTRMKINRKPKGNWKALYLLHIVGKFAVERFQEISHGSLIKKPDLYDKPQYDYTIPYSFVPNKYHNNKNVDVSITKVGVTKYIPNKVLGVEPADSCATFDIEVDDRNEFVAEGLLVHNSALWAGLPWNHPDVESFIAAKDWPTSVRALKEQDFNFPAPLDCTNISVCLDDDFFAAVKTDPVVKDLYYRIVKNMCKTGEPGFAINVGDKRNEVLRNPCVAGYTEVLTKDGYFPIESLVDKSVEVWNGVEWSSVSPKVTGTNQQLFRVSLSDGSSLDCTANHEWLIEQEDGFVVRTKTQDLKSGDALTYYPLPSVHFADGRFTAHSDSVVEIQSVKPIQTADKVYCFNEPSLHQGTFEGIVTGNCTEIVSDTDSDSCNVGSINLSRIGSIEELKRVTRIAVRFLYLGTYRSWLPHEDFLKIREQNRRIGLGFMGLHEWCIRNNERYAPNGKLGRWLSCWANISDDEADKFSAKLGGVRPIAVRAIAPTGTIGIIGETSTGMEPIYCVAYKRRYLSNGGKWDHQYVIDPAVDRLVKEGIVKDPNDIEDSIKLSKNVERRIQMQAFVQSFVDQGISSTINLPEWGEPGNNNAKQFADTLLEYLPKLRGVTVYPDGARAGQPITSVKYETALKHTAKVEVDEENCKGGVCGI